MPIDKNIATLLDALEDGFNRALPDPKTGQRGEWQPLSDIDGNIIGTFCNLFSNFVAQAFGYQKLAGKNANEIFDFLSSPANGWLKVDGDIAQSHANAGCLVFAVWKNPAGHGHICVICPGKMKRSNTFGKDVPKCVNVGRDVFFGKKISLAFRTEPAYYVLSEMV